MIVVNCLLIAKLYTVELRASNATDVRIDQTSIGLSPTPSRHLVETLWPELLKPLIRILRLISQLNLTLELGNIIPRLIVQSILLIRSIADIVRDGLDIVSDLLVADAGDIINLSVLESELIAKVGIDLGKLVLHR